MIGKLDKTIKYTLIDKKYIPLVDSMTCCDNCNKPIANIATVRDENLKTYHIGFDCLESVLLNNNLLDGKSIEEYNKFKKMLPKIIRFSKVIKEVLERHPDITGIRFNKPEPIIHYFPYYWIVNNSPNSRNNDGVKLKEVDLDILIEVLSDIFPKLQFTKTI